MNIINNFYFTYLIVTLFSGCACINTTNPNANIDNFVGEYVVISDSQLKNIDNYSYNILNATYSNSLSRNKSNDFYPNLSNTRIRINNNYSFEIMNSPFLDSVGKFTINVDLDRDAYLDLDFAKDKMYASLYFINDSIRILNPSVYLLKGIDENSNFMDYRFIFLRQ